MALTLIIIYNKNKKRLIIIKNQEGVYEYLGVDESDGIQHSKMKEKIRQ